MDTERAYFSERQARARARYHKLRKERPEWFVNHRGGFEILADEADMDRAEEQAWGALQAAQADGEVKARVDREWVMVGVLAEDAWAVVLRDAIRTPDGRLGVYRREMTAPHRAAGVVALATRQQKVLLLRHYRHALRRFSWEIPRGFGRRDESAAGTLERQLLEEIQAAPQNVRHLGTLEPDGGRLGDAVHLMAASIAAPGAPEAAEAIERYEFIDPADLRRRISRNEISDALTLAAVARAYCDGDLEI